MPGKKFDESVVENFEVWIPNMIFMHLQQLSKTDQMKMALDTRFAVLPIMSEVIVHQPAYRKPYVWAEWCCAVQIGVHRYRTCVLKLHALDSRASMFLLFQSILLLFNPMRLGLCVVVCQKAKRIASFLSTIFSYIRLLSS